MKIFMTGASGFVGSAVVQELLKNGHTVTGLARSENSSQAILKAGAQVLKGSLEDFEVLREGATSADAVIHTGFIHDFSKYLESCELDRKIIATLGAAVKGTKKPLLVTTGSAILPQGILAHETDHALSAKTHPRAATDEAVQLLVDQGVNASLVRLPPSVHGPGDHGFVDMLISIAKEKGSSAYIGEGKNRWPAVHRLDAGKLYQLALSKSTPGARFHAVAEEGINFKEIAEMIGKKLNLPIKSLKADDVEDHFTWFSRFAAFNSPASSRKTKDLLGWHPTQIGLLEDIEKNYFL